MTRQLLFSVTLKDCEVQHFRSGGKGGQNQNKRDTGCRIIHHPSGARGESREERSQLQNKRAAFRRMAATSQFKIWIARQTFEYDQRSRLGDPTKRWSGELRDEDLLIEVRRHGIWHSVENL